MQLDIDISRFKTAVYIYMLKIIKSRSTHKTSIDVFSLQDNHDKWNAQHTLFDGKLLLASVIVT